MTKSAKKRFCPVMQRDLSSAECGDNRVSRYACPAECTFNPYAPANYDMALALDDVLNKKATEYFSKPRRTGPLGSGNWCDCDGIPRRMPSMPGSRGGSSSRAMTAGGPWRSTSCVSTKR
jgi:hypothetical protein